MGMLKCPDIPTVPLMITIFQHGEDEGPGTIPGYLEDQEIPFSIHRLYAGDKIPEEMPEQLIILGGQMSINDTGEYPFFIREKVLVREMVGAGRPVLGICLGAQMIASAFGEEVRKGIREIGWKKVTCCEPAWNRIFPGTFPVFHWHGETFNLPAGATLLVRGSSVENQAFRLGSAVGVQFHPEVDARIIAVWARTLPADLRAAIIVESRTLLAGNTRRCEELLDAFIREWKR
jgi:GMP synthase-like glutamine amidotransferase